MKIEYISDHDPKPFEPLCLQITVQSAEELEALRRMTNATFRIPAAVYDPPEGLGSRGERLVRHAQSPGAHLLFGFLTGLCQVIDAAAAR